MKALRIAATVYLTLLILGACPPPEEPPQGPAQCVWQDDHGHFVSGNCSDKPSRS